MANNLRRGFGATARSTPTYMDRDPADARVRGHIQTVAPKPILITGQPYQGITRLFEEFFKTVKPSSRAHTQDKRWAPAVIDLTRRSHKDLIDFLLDARNQIVEAYGETTSGLTAEEIFRPFDFCMAVYSGALSDVKQELPIFSSSKLGKRRRTLSGVVLGYLRGHLLEKVAELVKLDKPALDVLADSWLERIVENVGQYFLQLKWQALALGDGPAEALRTDMNRKKRPTEPDVYAALAAEFQLALDRLSRPDEGNGNKILILVDAVDLAEGDASLVGATHERPDSFFTRFSAMLDESTKLTGVWVLLGGRDLAAEMKSHADASQWPADTIPDLTTEELRQTLLAQHPGVDEKVIDDFVNRCRSTSRNNTVDLRIFSTLWPPVEGKV